MKARQEVPPGTVVDLFEAKPATGLIGLAAVVLVLVVAAALKLRDWVPSILFGLAVVLVGVSAAVGRPSYEGLAVMVAVALATGVSFLSEYRSDREFEKLNADKDSVRVKVYRDGDDAYPTICGTGLEDYVGSAWGMGQYSALYGGAPALGLDRQALHAARLGFAHPASGRPVVFESMPPVDLTVKDGMPTFGL